MPSGIVKWFVEVFDQNDELTAVATILTMVQKSRRLLKSIATTSTITWPN
jgi:oxepin-CoA hydrolase/3-oxo-5,6-dehydrosuberyl-CoA semialdehyde dehydrogenase